MINRIDGFYMQGQTLVKESDFFKQPDVRGKRRHNEKLQILGSCSDPDCEVIKKRDPLLTGLLRIGSLRCFSLLNKALKTCSLAFVRRHQTASLRRTKHFSISYPVPSILVGHSCRPYFVLKMR